MKKDAIDYSRIFKACGFTKEKQKEYPVNTKVSHFLGQSFSENIAEFKMTFEKAIGEARALPLEKFKEPAEFSAAWQLAGVSSPTDDWDFLAYTDPEKTGILCVNGGLFTEESFEHFSLFGRGDPIWGDEILRLYFSLSWWREAICCVWAGLLIKDMAVFFKKRSEQTLLEAYYGFSQKCEFIAVNQMREIQMGDPLRLTNISDEEAHDFYKLYEKAALGSGDCERSVANAFRGWMREANIGTLQSYGLDYQTAHSLLLASSQRTPEIDIRLLWDQSANAYRFVCLVENNDIHGYKDDGKTARIPIDILCDFFENAPHDIKEDLIRLLIRGGWRKAMELFDKGLSHPID